ncbi:hypothetical protein ACHHYP_01277 [Achlya hypogyna]|uniref:Uncharacterized protein n=1 Tax=Achlya hypogyna TaxID=1202772 RepID=A0A1V9Z8V6_ACHHY|nr:hypothetical protein ACHHYP_01277 [Achlya hypogyna]
MQLQWKHQDGMNADDILTIMGSLASAYDTLSLSVEIASWVNAPSFGLADSANLSFNYPVVLRMTVDRVTLSLQVQDATLYNVEPSFPASVNISIEIARVPVAPMIAMPLGSTVVAEGATVVLHGLHIVGDVVSTSVNGLVPQIVAVALSVSDGLLTLASTANLTLTMGTGAGDPMIHFSGSISDVNVALAALTYVPDYDFNSRQHVESLEMAVTDTETNLTSTASWPIVVTDVNDPATIALSQLQAQLQGERYN